MQTPQGLHCPFLLPTCCIAELSVRASPESGAVQRCKARARGEQAINPNGTARVASCLDQRRTHETLNTELVLPADPAISRIVADECAKRDIPYAHYDTLPQILARFTA
jgi:hypothetical protein